MNRDFVAIILVIAFAVTLAFAVTESANATVIHFGNDVEFSKGGNHMPHYLLGSRIQVTTAITLTGVGVIFKKLGGHGEVGVYSDDLGKPGHLIADSGIFSIASTGRVELPLPAMSIDAGNYWFMAVYEVDSSIGLRTYIEGGPDVAYIRFGFGNALPSQFPQPLTYYGQEFNYYLIGTAVPEPSTLALAALGIFGLLIAARRNR